MNRWCSSVIGLMILWLPLQGFAAVAMPFCTHGSHVSLSAQHIGHPLAHTETRHFHGLARGASDSHLYQTVHANTPRHDGPPSGLACNDCGMCHLACSPVAPSWLNAIERMYVECFAQFSPALPPTFVPEQLTPPPLSAIA